MSQTASREVPHRGEKMADARVWPCERGFTVMEVVIAMTILLTALLGAAALFGNAIIVSGNTRNRVVAQNLATE
jgi:prepilin-type N-terminal cleavage/methylation domain-containing protein